MDGSSPRWKTLVLRMHPQMPYFTISQTHFVTLMQNQWHLSNFCRDTEVCSGGNLSLFQPLIMSQNKSILVKTKVR